MITPSFGLTATERVLPKLALDFTTASLDPRVTFTRTTDATHPATYVNSDGYITNATNNQPRFDYDPVTLVCKGLLIEESRSNILLKSNDFTDSATWSPTTVTVTPNAITSPDGTLSGTKLQSNSSGARVTQTVTASVTGQYTFTAFCKYGNSTLQRLLVYNLTTSTVIGSIQFNVQTGNIQATVAGSGVTSPAGNGWFRLGVVCSGITAGQQIIAYVYAGDTSNPAGTFCYAWGAQLEAGAFATSYIPTTTTALTRNADVATMTGTNVTNVYNATEGTLWVQAIRNGSAGQNYPLALFSDGTTNNQFYAEFYAATSYGKVGNSATLTGKGGVAANTITKVAVAGKANDAQICTDTSLNGSSSSLTMPTGINELDIGCFYNSGSIIRMYNGWIQKLAYYPQRLTNAQLQAITK